MVGRVDICALSYQVHDMLNVLGFYRGYQRCFVVHVESVYGIRIAGPILLLFLLLRHFAVVIFQSRRLGFRGPDWDSGGLYS